MVAGTPAYLSPEQACGVEPLDGRSDIYSVGALAYCLLTGGPPFAGRSAMQMLAAHLYEAPEPPSRRRPDVPADLEAVVLRCLEKDPGARYPDATALDVALAACRPADGGGETDFSLGGEPRLAPGGDPADSTHRYT
jgi:serine/threonine-protein kinase